MAPLCAFLHSCMSHRWEQALATLYSSLCCAPGAVATVCSPVAAVTVSATAAAVTIVSDPAFSALRAPSIEVAVNFAVAVAVSFAVAVSARP